MRNIIINADDFGLSCSICEVVIELLNIKAISNSTVMLCADGALDRCKAFANHPASINFGLHLQLTGGTPISNSQRVPSLVSVAGDFHISKNFSILSPDEVKQEWENQIIRFQDVFGRNPTHLDSHHGAHRVPRLRDVYIKLASKYRLNVRGFDDHFEKICQKSGVSCSSYVVNKWTGKGKSYRDLISIIENDPHVDRANSIEIVTHPGHVDPQLLKVSSMTYERETDYLELKKLAKSNALKSKRMNLISFPLENSDAP